MQQTKEKAPCTVAAVQNACNEPTKAQTYVTAIEGESQMFCVASGQEGGDLHDQ